MTRYLLCAILIFQLFIFFNGSRPVTVNNYTYNYTYNYNYKITQNNKTGDNSVVGRDNIQK